MRTACERRTAETPGDLVCERGRLPVPAVWTVRVWQCPLWHYVFHHCYMVQAFERHTGARVPSVPRRYSTLSQARQDAKRLFAVVAQRDVEPWHLDGADEGPDAFELVSCARATRCGPQCAAPHRACERASCNWSY